MTKVAINGFGRIGRNTLRAAIREGIYEKIDYVAINDPGLTPENAAFVFKYDYIFGPTYLSVLTSEDGNEYIEIARQDYPVDSNYDDGNGCREYKVDFPETSAKFLKVQAGCLETLPEWHSGKGRPGFVFVGEIIVK